MCEKTTSALKNRDVECAREVLDFEKTLNQLQVTLKENHIQRVNRGMCNLLAGIIFISFVDNIEKIGDHLTNIAEGVIKHLRWDVEINGE